MANLTIFRGVTAVEFDEEYYTVFDDDTAYFQNTVSLSSGSFFSTGINLKDRFLIIEVRNIPYDKMIGLSELYFLCVGPNQNVTVNDNLNSTSYDCRFWDKKSNLDCHSQSHSD